MTIRALEEALEVLPFSLAEQVLSYAKSVEAAAPDIFRSAGLRQTPEITNKLVFVAGIRKLFSIIDSNYWVIDNAGEILERQQDQGQIRVGGTDLSRGGDYHRELSRLRDDFQNVISESNLEYYVSNVPYAEVVRTLSDGY